MEKGWVRWGGRSKNKGRERTKEREREREREGGGERSDMSARVGEKALSHFYNFQKVCFTSFSSYQPQVWLKLCNPVWSVLALLSVFKVRFQRDFATSSGKKNACQFICPFFLIDILLK